MSGSPSTDELSLELERAKLRNDPSLLAAANKLVQDVLRKAREEALRRIKYDNRGSTQVRRMEWGGGDTTEPKVTIFAVCMITYCQKNAQRKFIEAVLLIGGHQSQERVV